MSQNDLWTQLGLGGRVCCKKEVKHSWHSQERQVRYADCTSDLDPTLNRCYHGTLC